MRDLHRSRYWALVAQEIGSIGHLDCRSIREAADMCQQIEDLVPENILFPVDFGARRRLSRHALSSYATHVCRSESGEQVQQFQN